MLLTLTLSYRFHTEHETRSLEHFNDASKQTAALIAQAITDHQEIIQSGVAYYNASENVTADEWNSFYIQVQAIQKYPAIKRIKLLRLDAPDTAIALNDSRMRESMIRSLQTGKAAITTSIDGSVTYITVPLYPKNQSIATLTPKRSGHIGWVMGVINTRELFAPLQGELTRNLDFTISDVHHVPIFTTLTTLTTLTKHYKTSSAALMGNKYFIKTQSTPTSLAKIHLDVSRYALISGTLFSLLLLLVLRSFNKNRRLTDIKNRELKLLSALINESNDMVFIIRIDDGYVEYANKTANTMLGYTLNEIQAMGIEGFRRPLKEGEPFMEHLKELHKMGHLTDYAILTRKDGTEFPIEANVRLLSYRGTDYNIAVVRDISENELYNQKLHHLTQHLNEAQKIAKLGSWCLNLDTGELEWSDEIYELFEIDQATHTPTYEGFLDAIHPDDREMVNTAYTDSVEHHTPYNYVHRLLMRDGRIKYVREQGETFYDQDGTPHESRGTVHDITGEILLQQRLELKNNELMEVSARSELAIQAANMGIWVFYFADNTFVADAKVLELYEMSPDLLNVPLNFEEWTSRCHPDDVQKAVALLHEVASGAKNLDITFRIIVPSGIKYIHAAAIVKYDNDGHPIGIVGTNQDVTINKTLEETRILAQTSAEAANKIKSDFLANMSHEIRTPLNGVIGLTELLLQSELQPLQREYLKKSDTASRALLNVLNNILDYSKIEAHKLVLEMTTFNLDDIMDNLIAMLSYKAEQKNLSLETHIDDTIPRMLIGDPLRLQQILSNLIVNALKFTEQGYVRISISAIPQDQEDHIKLAFAISDSGIGISEDDQPTLFQPFSQVDASFTRKYGGSGLGLMITKELVELMGGEITVHSVKGEGSTFTFDTLFECATMIPSSENKTCPYPFALPNDKPLHLLLVEDNDLNQLVASERLKQMGITCSIANNGLEAVEMVQKETFDAVLMDLQMPVMDGLEATREIRKLEGFANLPIIALSAAVLQDDLTLAFEAGMNDFVAKPIDKILLQNVLTKWLSD